MPMSEFRDKYAGDINAVLLEDINRCAQMQPGFQQARV